MLIGAAHEWVCSVQCALTRGPVMSPGAIGARQRVAAVQALRALRAVAVRVLHSAVLQPQHNLLAFIHNLPLCYTQTTQNSGTNNYSVDLTRSTRPPNIKHFRCILTLLQSIFSVRAIKPILLDRFKIYLF